MKNKIYILLIFILLAGSLTEAAEKDLGPTRNEKLKAAFIYNFLKFVEWPKDEVDDSKDAGKVDDSEDVICIGIIGEDSFEDAFKAIINKRIGKKQIIIKRFDSYKKLQKLKKNKDKWEQQVDSLKECHLLFICSSEKAYVSEILSILKESPVLTVSETNGFLEKGGIIKFVVDRKVQFEVNMKAVKRSGLNISSKLLRLAKKVIKDNNEDKKR
jgi:hypothetical protein